MENEAENVIKDLTKILTNFKKAPNRRYLRETLQEKLKEASESYENILYLLENYEQHHQKALLRDARNIFSEIKIFVDIRLDCGKHLLKFKTISKIVFVFIKLYKKYKKMPFDFKTATSLVQPYDGSPGGLDSFVDASNLLQELTEAANAAVAAKFLKTRLTGKARIGLPEGANTIALIVQDVKNRCQDKTTAESIQAKLKAAKFKNSSQNFCEEIEKLAFQLKSAYISSKIPEDVASKMSTKSGVDALINGINNQEVKLILKAGTFTDLKDAIQKVNENVLENSNVQVLSFNGRQNNFRKNNRYNHNNGRNNNYRNHNGNRNNNHGSNHVYPQRNHNPNYSQQRYSHSQNFNSGRGRGRNNNNYARNVYMTDTNSNTNHSTHGVASSPTTSTPPQINFLAHMDQLPQTTQRPYSP